MAFREVLGLGLDVGTTNTKAALVALWPGTPGEVRVLASTSAPTPDDAGALVGVTLTLIHTVLGGASRAPDVVGLASMAETGVPLDAGGQPLRPFLRWDGDRASAQARSLASDLGGDALFAATGVRPSAKVPLATWAWLRDNEPDVWQRMCCWAGAADVLCQAMTGRLATDHTLAGRTMAYRLPDRDGALSASFDADLLGAVGLRPDQLPDVVGVDEIAGRVTDPAFVGAGLIGGTPVVVAGHDHAVGAYAAGVREPGDVADSIGTAEAVLTVLSERPDPAAVAAAGMSLVRTVSGHHDALLAGSASGGAMVVWWLAAMTDGRPAAEVFAEMAQAPAEATGVLVLPYPTGRQSPAPDPAARVRVIGRTAAHSPAHLTRALFEGLCLQARWMLVEQARLSGRERAADAVHADSSDDEIAVLGAVTANPAWMAVKAAVTPGPLRVVDNREPVAAGAAVLGADRAGLLPHGAPRLPGRRPVAGSPEASRAMPGTGYDQMFADFVTAALGHDGDTDDWDTDDSDGAT